MSVITMTGPKPVTFQGSAVTYADNAVTFQTLTTPVGLLEETLSIEDQADGRSTASFRVYQGDQPLAYRLGQIKQIASDGNLVFGGVIDRLVEREDVHDDLWLDVNMVDYVAVLDRHLVAGAFESETAGAIIRSILSSPSVSTVFLEELGDDLVEDGPEIQKVVFNYVTVTQAMNELAQYAGYQWNVTPDKTVVFKSRSATSAPFSITDASNNYRSLQVERDKLEYRNRQYLRAGKDLTDPRTETFVGDGETQTFVMSFPIGQVPTVKVNGVEKTVGIRGVNENRDWYWNKEDAVLSQDDDGTPLTNQDTLAVTYRGLFPIIVVSDNLGEQAARATDEGTSGMYASVAQDATLDDSDNAVTKAESLLAKFGSFNNGIQFETDDVVEPNAVALRAGDLMTIQKTTHDLEAECLVESVSLQRVGTHWRVQGRALTGMQTMSWLRYWQDLSEQQQGLSQRENEVLIIGGSTTSFTDNVAFTDTISATPASPESRVGFAQVGLSEVGS